MQTFISGQQVFEKQEEIYTESISKLFGIRNPGHGYEFKTSLVYTVILRQSELHSEITSKKIKKKKKTKTLRS